MALETGDYISDLVITNPVGATDPKSQGDDHIRLLKKTVKQTFPNLSGAMTLTHGNLNALAPFFTDPNADRIAFWDDSAGAFAFLAPDGTSIAISGTTLATGSNVPLLNAANQFTAANQFRGSTEAFRMTDGTNFNGAYRNDQANWMTAQIGSSGYRWRNSSNSADVMSLSAAGVLTINGVAHTDFAQLSQINTFTGSTAGGRQQINVNTNNAANAYAAFWNVNDASRRAALVRTSSGYTGPFLSGGSASEGSVIWSEGNYPLDIGTNDTARLIISGAGNFDFKAGTVTTNNASASEVGKTGAPARNISASTNTAASDQGGTVRMTGGSGQTFTLDSDVPADCFVLLDNASGNSWTIAASGTLTWAATGGTGSRTLANGGLAVALSLGSGNYKITGGGLS